MEESISSFAENERVDGHKLLEYIQSEQFADIPESDVMLDLIEVRVTRVITYCRNS